MKRKCRLPWMGACAALLTVTLVILVRAGDNEKKTEEEKTMSTEPDKKSKEELRKRLTPEQFHVAVESGTEPAFHNAYWDNHKPGLYVDVISGEPLFSSADKFDSGTGWPSFTKAVKKENVIEKSDRTHGMIRTEVRSKKGDAHLGHLFEDGPAPTGLRYCINSASLRFIPVEKLEEEGYGEYLKLFEKKEK